MNIDEKIAKANYLADENISVLKEINQILDDTKKRFNSLSVKEKKKVYQILDNVSPIIERLSGNSSQHI